MNTVFKWQRERPRADPVTATLPISLLPLPHFPPIGGAFRCGLILFRVTCKFAHSYNLLSVKA